MSAHSHLSDLVLDRVRAGEIAISTEAMDCEVCRSRLAGLDAAATRLSPDAARLLLAARVQLAAAPPATPSLKERWFALAAAPAGLALALGLVVVVLPQMNDETIRREPAARVLPAETNVIRTKGARLEVTRKRGEAVDKVRSGDRVLPGDQLRLDIAGGPAAQLLVLGVETSGKVSAYHPFGGTESVPVGAGLPVTLRGSLVLDDAPDDEVLFALFTHRPVDVDAVRAAVAALGDGPLTLEQLRTIPELAHAEALVLDKATAEEVR